jgi:hypothetical protein
MNTVNKYWTVTISGDNLATKDVEINAPNPFAAMVRAELQNKGWTALIVLPKAQA